MHSTTTALYSLFQTRCVVSSPLTESVLVMWPVCLQVFSNILVCVDITIVNTFVSFRPDGCVHHNHSALSHDVIIFVSNVIGDTGQQIGVTTESESADDTGQQVGVVSVMRFSVPDSLFKFRDEVSHANYLNQLTTHRQVPKLSPQWTTGTWVTPAHLLASPTQPRFIVSPQILIP